MTTGSREARVFNRINRLRIVNILYIHEAAFVAPEMDFRLPSPKESNPAPARLGGFTLVELLVVVAVMVVLMTLAIPAFNAIRGGTDFTSEVYNVAGTYDQARAYAVANNTYVLAGIFEVSAPVYTSGTPAVGGTGWVVMAVIASKTGMRPYQSLFPSGLTTWNSTGYGTGTSFVAVTKLLELPNLHLVDLQYNGTTPLSLPATGNMARPGPALIPSYDDLSNAPESPSIRFSSQFAWPLGTTLTGGQYKFVKVVEFDPQGTARIIWQNFPVTFPDAVPPYIEVGLQPAHGAVAAGPPASQSSGAGQIAAVQIAGITGATHIYRP